MKRICLNLVLLIFCHLVYSQNVEWANHIPGNAMQSGAIQITQDSGVVLFTSDGSNVSAPGTIFNNSHGDDDVWCIKYDKNGQLLWKKNFGGTGLEYSISSGVGSSLIDDDDNIIFVVNTQSNDIDVQHSLSATVVSFLMKIDKNGVLLWKKLINIPGNNTRFSTGILQFNSDSTAFFSSTFASDNSTISIYIIKHMLDGTQIWEHQIVANIEVPGNNPLVNDMYANSPSKLIPTRDGGVAVDLEQVLVYYYDQNRECDKIRNFIYKIDQNGVFEYQKKMYHTDLNQIPLNQRTAHDSLENRRFYRSFAWELLPNKNVRIFESVYLPMTTIDSSYFDPLDTAMYLGAYGGYNSPLDTFPVIRCEYYKSYTYYETMLYNFNSNYDYSTTPSNKKYRLGLISYEYDFVTQQYSNEVVYSGNKHDYFFGSDNWNNKFLSESPYNTILSSTGTLAGIDPLYIYEFDDNLTPLSRFKKSQVVNVGGANGIEITQDYNNLKKRNGVYYAISNVLDMHYNTGYPPPTDIVIAKLNNLSPIVTNIEASNTLAEVVIYPNPSISNSFTIQFQEILQKVRVTNLIGESIPINFSPDNKTVDFVNDIPAGIYLVRIVNNKDEEVVKRFIKR